MTKLSLRGSRFIPVRFPYDGRVIRWNDNLPEDGGIYLFLTLETEEGLKGVAEATVKPTWLGGSARSLAAVVEDVLLPRLAAVNLADDAAVSAAIAPVPENSAAKMLVQNACWDLQAQAADTPLWRLWGGDAEVALSWTLTRAAPAAMAEEARAMVERYGFGTLKVKGGQGVLTDAEGMRRIREAVGESVKLYSDANWQYEPGDGMAFVRAIAAEGAVLAEDPWALAANAQFREAARSLPIPILVDFFCRGPRDTPVFMDYGASAFAVKPGRIGLSDARIMAKQCARGAARIVVGQFAESMIGSLHALSFAAAFTPGFAAESSFFLMFPAIPLTAPLAVRDGRLRLPTAAGFAPLVDWNLLERHRLN